MLLSDDLLGNRSADAGNGLDRRCQPESLFSPKNQENGEKKAQKSGERRELM